jgi:hypothetical protein
MAFPTFPLSSFAARMVRARAGDTAHLQNLENWQVTANDKALHLFKHVMDANILKAGETPWYAFADVIAYKITYRDHDVCTAVVPTELQTKPEILLFVFPKPTKEEELKNNEAVESIRRRCFRLRDTEAAKLRANLTIPS